MPRTPRSNQLTLDQARRPDGRHGGWRPGAGRKRRSRNCSHLRRESLSKHHPCHVTLRAVDGLPLRRAAVLEAIRAAIEASHKEDFRVTHFNVLGNHLHLITEADHELALARGMQGLMVRLARAINRVLGRTGSVFRDRYHARALTSPREVRNALRYVLCNARHHAAERGQRLARTWIDPYSSAPWFDGWRDPIVDQPWLRPLLRRFAPTAPARTWLLTQGWRRHGLLAFDEVPG
jgi:REP element-mobilizing transposase RayT